MSTHLSRSQAKRWTLGAQAGSLLCVLGVVVVGMVGLPEHAPGVTLEQARTNARAFASPVTNANNAANDANLEQRTASIDALGLAQRLALLDNAPVPPVVAQNDTQDDNAEDADDTDTNGVSEEEITIARRVKYIGFINDARTPRAFIRLDGRQRIVSAGETALSADEGLPDLQVQRVTPRMIVLSDGEARAAIDLASNSGSSVTMVSADQIETASDNDGSLLSDDEEAYIQSLPPRQQPGARRRLEREKRGLPAENPNRRPTPEPLVTIQGDLNQRDRAAEIRRRRALQERQEQQRED